MVGRGLAEIQAGQRVVGRILRRFGRADGWMVSKEPERAMSFDPFEEQQRCQVEVCLGQQTIR